MVVYIRTSLLSSHALQGLFAPPPRSPLGMARCRLRAEDPVVPSPIPPLYEASGQIIRRKYPRFHGRHMWRLGDKESRYAAPVPT